MGSDSDSEDKGYTTNMFKISRDSKILWFLNRCFQRLGTGGLTLSILFLGSLVLIEYNHLAKMVVEQQSISESYESAKVELHSCISEKTDLVLELHHEAQKKEKDLSRTKRQIQGFKDGHRLVHIDLKGAPPKMEYLIQLLPFFARLGATGILLEYEDMFPYKGNLRILSNKNAYSYSQIKELLSKAASQKLQVIPLIQTFGHFEFVLKHKEFEHLRETKRYPNALCPLAQESQELVFKMIEQVLKMHPGITRIHVGGDEIFNFADCSRCKKSKKSKSQLYLNHMLPILSYVIRKGGGSVIPIIWDDMLRKWPLEDMKRISSLAEIMVWGYTPDLDGSPLFTEGMWEKYAKAFNGIWVASSYKGAIRPDANLPPLSMHIENHLSWLKIIRRMSSKTKIMGVALTGWIRFDHFATLCELLPAGIPSLGICLRVLIDGQYSVTANRYVGSILGYESKIQIAKDPFGSYDTTIGKFPGADVYSLATELENFVSWVQNNENRLDSWGNFRQERLKQVSPLQMEETRKALVMILPALKNFNKKCEDVLKKYFFEDSIHEWIEDKVDLLVRRAKKLNERLGDIFKALNLSPVTAEKEDKTNTEKT